MPLIQPLREIPSGAVPFAATAILLLAFVVSMPCLGAPPDLETDNPNATAGYYVLSWSGAQGPYDLIEESSASDEPRVLYSGPDSAMLISGKPDGRYVYRVRTQGDPVWSEPVTVTVEHHPLLRAWTFFAHGALVFFSTLLVVLRGGRSN
jgi:hypothetical protein